MNHRCVVCGNKARKMFYKFKDNFVLPMCGACSIDCGTLYNEDCIQKVGDNYIGACKESGEENIEYLFQIYGEHKIPIEDVFGFRL